MHFPNDQKSESFGVLLTKLAFAKRWEKSSKHRRHNDTVEKYKCSTVEVRRLLVFVYV